MFYTGVLRTLIISAFLLLTVKTVDMIIMASIPDSEGILVSESQAAAKPKPKEPKKPPAPKAEPAPAPAADAAAPADSKSDAKDAKEAGKDSPKDKDAPPPVVGGTIEAERPVSIDEVHTFSDAEIDVLKRLSERRERLAKWENDLQIKENVLKITEEKIDTKLEDLRKLKKEVEVSLTEYRKQEDAKTLSLVKIYENMKPKSAADILSKMRVDDVIPIIDKMKQKNSAEILAKMDPKFAKDVTTKLNRIGQIKAQ